MEVIVMVVGRGERGGEEEAIVVATVTNSVQRLRCIIATHLALLR